MGNFVFRDFTLLRRADMEPFAVMHDAEQPVGFLRAIIQNVERESAIGGVREQAWMQDLYTGKHVGGDGLLQAARGETFAVEKKVAATRRAANTDGPLK